MRTLYLDCFAGVSGDMLLGALIDCGLDLESLQRELARLDLGGYRLGIERVDRSGISATKFHVSVGSEFEHGLRAEAFEQGQQGQQGHRSHAHHDHPHRPLTEIRRLIQTSGLSDGVKLRALAIFERLGEAEAKIHNVPLETVQFHEVGAVDSIVDIVGAAVGLEKLAVERIISSALHVGSGTFSCQHGTYPVPGPATAELLRGVPIYSREIDGELVTPTGAAIVSTIASEFGPLPMMRMERIGYGAGTRQYPRFPNVLRVLLGETEIERTPTSVAVVETNIDDLNPQVFGHLMEQLLVQGALDVFYIPVHMKKNRPGILLTMLCAPEDRERLSAVIFRETTTLGVRYRIEAREVLERAHVSVATPFGEIRIKVAYDRHRRRVNYAPEYDDCAAAAERYDVAIREVQSSALASYLSNETGPAESV